MWVASGVIVQNCLHSLLQCCFSMLYNRLFISIAANSYFAQKAQFIITGWESLVLRALICELHSCGCFEFTLNFYV